jgi:hypothetical protein
MITSERRSARRAEVERDRQLVTAKLLHDLQHLHGQVAPETDPEHLWQVIDAKLAASRETHRRLTHARVSLRGERAAAWDDSRPLPVALACYRHRGNYRGGFRSMAAIGVILGPCGCPRGAPQPDPAALAHELHLRGELWTFELGGLVHVFTTPGSCSDEALALLQRSRGPHARVADS